MNGQRLAPHTLKQLIADAYGWVEEHPAYWDWIVGGAQRDAMQIGRVYMDAYLDNLRTTRVPWSRTPIDVPAAYSAAFVLFLWEWEPDLRPAIGSTAPDLGDLTIPAKPCCVRG